ncbi:MAG: hypothetical protein JWN34_3210 [Bryobacterales bacterium]|nr:hypothetical protein [Bryobacterales bacterium]
MVPLPPLVDGLRQAIRENVRSEKIECKTAIIRQLLPDIKAATDAGFTYVQIAAWLAKAQGFSISGKHLAVIVSQIKQRKKAKEPKAQLNMFDKLKADKAADTAKRFTHDPVSDAKGLM